MINNNYQPNFTSTYIPNLSKFNMMDAAAKLEPYFTVKAFGKTTPSKVRERIDYGQAAIGLDEKNSSWFVTAKDREADEFIARQLRPEDIHINYIQDTPETKFDGPVFDLNDFNDLDITV